MDTPEALERQIHRIHELLVRTHEAVTWNDHISDPDNPAQLRQIDITIRQNGALTLIECRLCKRRQDVKWIEELIGRRQSLGAQEIIGVSSAGFTAGAKKKAERYGIHVRDLKQLSDDEIANWGRRVALTIYYYQYSEAVLSVGFAIQSIPKLDLTVLSAQLRSHPVVQSVFNAAASQLDELKLLANDDKRTIGVRILVRPENVLLSGEPVLEIGLDCKARLIAWPIASPYVFGYGHPGDAPAQREATIERFAFGETNIVHQDDRIAVDIDLSSVTLPPLSQIRFIRTTSVDELDYQSLAINNPRCLSVKDGPFKADIYGIHPSA